MSVTKGEAGKKFGRKGTASFVTVVHERAVRRFFRKSSRPPARMISDSLEVGKQRQNESTKGEHARFEPGT